MFQKYKKIKSKKIRQSAKGEDCAIRIPGICNHDNQTTVLAHVNSRFSGISTKSNDIHGVYACSKCHDWMDGRIKSGHSQSHRERDILRALIETQMKLIQKGLIEVK